MFWKANRHALLALIAMSVLFFANWFFEEQKVIAIPHDGKPTVLYTNQDGTDLRQIYKQAIERAQKSVVMLIYSLNDNVIINALKAKASQGIPVTVIGDVEASAKAESRLGKQIKYYKHDNSRGLMHMKILVIDDKETWIGSANMTGESLRMHGNLIMAIASPSVAKTVLDKARGMITPKGYEGYPHQDFVVGGQELELWFLPDDPLAIKRLVELIRQARSSLRVGMFTWTRRDLAEEVIKKHRQGIPTQVIIDQNAGTGAGKEVVEMLTEAGVPVLLSQGTALFHYKMLCIDDKILINGSANWTRAAFSKNEDCFVVLHDLNEAQRHVINELWKLAYQHSEEVYEKAR